MKTIELEMRAEVPEGESGKLLAHLKRHGRLISKTRRCSAMFFGAAHHDQYDLRVRITNGQAELVIKKGGLHKHDRIEFSQAIARSEMLGLVRVFSLLGFEAKVGERQTMNFDFGKGTIVSLVKAGKITYLEVERMTNSKKLKNDKMEVLNVLKDLGYTPLNKDSFMDLCHRLTKHTDWVFKGTIQNLKKLDKVLKRY